MNAYVLLGAAIVLEIIGTSLVKASDGMNKLLPASFGLLCIGVCFYLLSLSMRTIPTGIAYAIWSGVGIVAISVIGLVIFKQKLDLPAVLGIALICSGVLVINLFSKQAGH